MDPHALAQKHCRRLRASHADPDALVRATHASISPRPTPTKRRSSASGVRAAARTVGLKVGFANKAAVARARSSTRWSGRTCTTTRCALRRRRRRIALDGVDVLAKDRAGDRVQDLEGVRIAGPDAPRCRRPTRSTSVEWLAVGFEIIDCVYPDWKFQPADFVAAYGLHAALDRRRTARGRSRSDSGSSWSSCRDSPSASRENGEIVAEGSGRNSLRSPALCLAELQAALARQAGATPLAAGESGQLRHVDRVAGDRGRRDLERRARGDRPEAIDRDPRLKPARRS